MNPLFADDVFFNDLRDLDHDLFLAIKALLCPRCQGKLDTANYPRKPRGLGELESIRFSLCCRTDGCRHRVTPPSLRFLGKKVYSAWVVILFEFAQELGLSREIARQTLARWRNFWNDSLASDHPFMRAARSFLPPNAPMTNLPSSLLDAFKFRNPEAWIPILRFFTHPF